MNSRKPLAQHPTGRTGRPEINQGYPTREELAEVLEAHKSGGEAGILAYLKKKRAEREAK